MFSIIIPSYNRNDELNALLESLEQQTEQNFEVIVVDDHSKNPVKTDRTFSFPINIIRNQKNKGPAESRNVGAGNAGGEWLLFLDDDDRFDKDKCRLLTDIIKQNPSVNFLYHPAECLMVNENFIYYTHPYKNIRDLTLDNMLSANKIGGMPMIAITKQLFLKVGGLSDELLSLEDYEFILKLVSDADFAPQYVDKALTKCTFHTKRSSVSTNTENTEKAIELIRQKYAKTDIQQKNFKLNSLYMLAYPNMMNLSRKAAEYYWQIFKLSGSLKYLIMALMTYISPKLAINLKRFV